MTESLDTIFTISSILLGAVLAFIGWLIYSPAVRELVKTRTFWVEFSAALSIVFIFIYFTTMGLLSTVKPIEDTLWNPYIFGGMPAVLIQQGIRWHNLANTFFSGQIFYMHKNPIMYCIFIYFVGVLYIKWRSYELVFKYYILVIIVEFLMIFTTDFTNI